MRPTLRAAFSLLELMIVMVILAAVMMMASTSLTAGSKLTERMTIENDLAAKANRVLNKLALELRTIEADYDILKVGPSYESMSTDVDGDGSSESCTIYTYRAPEGIHRVVRTKPVSSTTTATYTYNDFSTQFENGTEHQLVYVWDTAASKSRITGTLWRLLVQIDDPDTVAVEPTVVLTRDLLCDQIRTTSVFYPNRRGFFIDQIGNTLQMELVLEQIYRAGHPDERVVHASDAQVLFLRSTLNSNTGSCPYNSEDEAEYLDWSVNYPYPQIIFGHRLNWLSDTTANPKEQITISIQPPVGYELDESSVWVYIQVIQDSVTGASYWQWVPRDDTPTTTDAWEKYTYTYAGTTYYTDLVRKDRTPLASNGTRLPTMNGQYTVTLDGQITGSIIVWCYAQVPGWGGNWFTKSY